MTNQPARQVGMPEVGSEFRHSVFGGVRGDLHWQDRSVRLIFRFDYMCNCFKYFHFEGISK